VTPVVGGTTLLLVGAMLIRLTVTDAYQRYVRIGMGPLLLIAGVLLAALGTVAVVRALRAGPDADADHTDHEDHTGHAGHEDSEATRVTTTSTVTGSAGCCWCRCSRCCWSSRPRSAVSGWTAAR
jgi:hypothetical protein